MKIKTMKLLSLFLAGLMLLGTFVACDNSDDEPDETKKNQSEETGEKDAADIALEKLDADFGKEDFTVLTAENFKSEVSAKAGIVDPNGGSDQTINDAVHERNTYLEDRFNLKFTTIEKDESSLITQVQTEAQAKSGDFQLINTRIDGNASLATSGYLYNLLNMGMEFDGEWWDKGTAEFVLNDAVYFMTGSININDDSHTYIMAFNKDMQKEYAAAVPDPYKTVKAGEWTLDYFEKAIQGIASENGDGKYDEKDKYGFITSHEYGTTFFIGSGLQYIKTSEGEDPSLFLDSGLLDKATTVLGTARRIYWSNNATYISTPGDEPTGIKAFEEGHALFLGETSMHLTSLNANMSSSSGDGAFGILPVPKYDKNQSNYRTWVHPAGSSFSATSALSEDEAEIVGQIFEGMAILSHKTLRPAYYETTLRTKIAQDPESAEMLDIVFGNRVYDMAFYFNFGFKSGDSSREFFTDAVYKNTDNFISKYNSQSTRFNKRLNDIMKGLDKIQ